MDWEIQQSECSPKGKPSSECVNVCTLIVIIYMVISVNIIYTYQSV